MWNGFCGNLIRRSNRNLLIFTVLLLAAIVAVAILNTKYFTSFFAGAHVETTNKLAADDPAKLPDMFVRLPVDDAVATGLQHITKDDSHPSGYVDSEYLATRVGNKILLIRASGANWADDVPAQTFEGRFRALPDDVLSKVSESNPKLQFIPVYLDTVDYKGYGYILLIFGIPLFLLGAVLLWRYLQFSGDFTRHPFAKPRSTTISSD